MITRRGFLGSLAALVVGGGQALLHLATPAPVVVSFAPGVREGTAIAWFAHDGASVYLLDYISLDRATASVTIKAGRC